MAQEQRAPTPIGRFIGVPYWQDTDAEVLAINDLLGMTVVISECKVHHIDKEEDPYDGIAMLGVVSETGGLFKAMCFSRVLLEQLTSVPEEAFPVAGVIVQKGSGQSRYYTFE